MRSRWLGTVYYFLSEVSDDSFHSNCARISWLFVQCNAKLINVVSYSLLFRYQTVFIILCLKYWNKPTFRSADITRCTRNILHARFTRQISIFNTQGRKLGLFSICWGEVKQALLSVYLLKGVILTKSATFCRHIEQLINKLVKFKNAIEDWNYYTSLPFDFLARCFTITSLSDILCKICF